jgi:hypothetical protein
MRLGLWDPHKINVVAQLLDGSSIKHVISYVDITTQSNMLQPYCWYPNELGRCWLFERRHLTFGISYSVPRSVFRPLALDRSCLNQHRPAET